jgi:hypothetical protein
LRHVEEKVLAAIYEMGKGNTVTGVVSVATMAGQLGLSFGQAQQACKDLESKGLARHFGDAGGHFVITEPGKQLADRLTSRASAPPAVGGDTQFIPQLHAQLAAPPPNALVEFNDRLARVFPGKLGLFKIADQRQIDRVLDALCDNPRACGLRWTNGLMDADVREVRRLSGNVWLVGNVECPIEAVWVNKDAAVQRQFLVLQCAPSPSFGFVQTPQEWEEASWYVDRYITPDEAFDGYATIDDEVVKLDGPAEPRLRCTQRHFMFLTTSDSYLVQAGNQDIVIEVNQMISSSEAVTPSMLEPLRKLRSGR